MTFLASRPNPRLGRPEVLSLDYFPIIVVCQVVCVCVCTPVSVLSFGVSEDDGRASVLSVFDVDWDQFMGTGGSTLDVTG